MAAVRNPHFVGSTRLARLSSIEAGGTRDGTAVEALGVWDNYATHKTAMIRDWLAKRPRWNVHLSSDWLNQAERFVALLTEKQIRRGVRCSAEQLEAAINAFLTSTMRNQLPSGGSSPLMTSWPRSSPSAHFTT